MPQQAVNNPTVGVLVRDSGTGRERQTAGLQMEDSDCCKGEGTVQPHALLLLYCSSLLPPVANRF